ncbi:uncharacterized protein CMC5_069580 [Chondromyces crocatus]|uniref:Uncharacterized protein n=1 Tax=Chondromyces crocatus TaxID=52 RepID=A0A0K1EPF4_CHOCO|nr:uncharacterized protein CMC5_069580 [Chondromyces crocatus]
MPGSFLAVLTVFFPRANVAEGLRKGKAQGVRAEARG